MSVRNQYARNYYKIAPLPLSSNHITNARIAARRRNMYRPPDDDSCNSTGTTNIVTEMEKKADFSELESVRETEDVFSTRKNNNTKKGSEVAMFGKREVNKQVLTGIQNRGNDLCTKEDRRIKAKYKNIKDNVSSQQVQKSLSNITLCRPMSARPESRWERRIKDEYEDYSDEGSDDNYINFFANTSNTQNLKQIHCPESEVVPHFPARPKTSHGRQKLMDSNACQVESKKEHRYVKHERPKSRTGKKKETRRSSDESIDVPMNSNKNSNQRKLYDRNDKTGPVFYDTDYHVGINTFYPDLADKIHGIDDINLQIEDIDRDVDPVLFFMQDNNNSLETNTTNKSSLSKDAISVITNEKNSRQTVKAAIGFQGNNQNKRHSAPEMIDRFHGNRVLSLQNSIAEGNQRYFNNGRQDRIKSDSGGYSYKSRTSTSHIDKSLSTCAEMKRDSEMGKQSSNNDVGSPQTFNITINRKPRKLKPITPSNFEE